MIVASAIGPSAATPINGGLSSITDTRLRRAVFTIGGGHPRRASGVFGSSGTAANCPGFWGCSRPWVFAGVPIGLEKAALKKSGGKRPYIVCRLMAPFEGRRIGKSQEQRSDSSQSDIASVERGGDSHQPAALGRAIDWRAIKGGQVLVEFFLRPNPPSRRPGAISSRAQEGGRTYEEPVAVARHATHLQPKHCRARPIQHLAPRSGAHLPFYK